MDVMHCAPLVAATASVPPRPAGIILILMLMPRPALLCLARQVEALASYDNGGKVVVCDPTCDDGSGNSSHCNCECILPPSVILGPMLSCMCVPWMAKRLFFWTALTTSL